MSDDGDADPQRYPGLVTRAIAFVADAALINLVALIVGAAVALAVSLFHLPKDVKSLLAIIGAGAYIVWTIAYFVMFWSTTGQTPGARLMQIRVIAASGDVVKPRRGVLRCIGLVLAALPLFAGYLLILFDGRRRGFQDRLARTLVVDAPQLSVAAERRVRWQGNRKQHDGYLRGNHDGAARSPVSGDDENAPASHAVSGRGIRV